MMLGLASHEPHFSLLREEVKFGKMANNKRPTTAEETTFHLLHLSLFREYLDAEFGPLRVSYKYRTFVNCVIVLLVHLVVWWMFFIFSCDAIKQNDSEKCCKTSFRL